LCIRAKCLTEIHQLPGFGATCRNAQRKEAAIAIAHAERLRTAARREIFAWQRKHMLVGRMLKKRVLVRILREDSEKLVEKTALGLLCGSAGLAAAKGIVARGQLLSRGCIVVAGRLGVGETCLQLPDLRVEARTLRRLRTEQEELRPVAAKAARLANRLIKVRALLLLGGAI